ncbi:MAG: 4-hydroxy-tetrahydrodipicolinate reductase [Oscillospiraceae bacterium]|jgi:4-hydroxy-tetrahydrodipicolinate reductase|nr:4-hydroxy-tetrahydrodipicolinate reductase [Oscillospiraceae bacterium]
MKLFLSGYGQMGRMIEALALARGHEIIGRGDIDDLSAYDTAPAADACMDFSGVGARKPLAAYIRRTKTPLVSGTTGLSQPDMDELQALSAVAPVIWTANYSLGVAVLRRMLRDYAPALRDWDKELVEMHHNRKADAPSGTAKQLLHDLDPQETAQIVHGREGVTGARSKNEIGVFSLRGGSVAGEHTVYFFGEDEMLSLTHSASSRRVFAAGALRAAEEIAGKPPGSYTLEDLIF